VPLELPLELPELEPPVAVDPPEPLALDPPVVALDAAGLEELPPPQAQSASAATQTATRGSATRNFCKTSIQ
jgi:hypothetical protein